MFDRSISLGRRNEVVLRLLFGQRGPMTPDGARDVLNARAAAAGLSDVHPHRFDTPSPTAGSPAAVRHGT